MILKIAYISKRNSWTRVMLIMSLAELSRRYSYFGDDSFGKYKTRQSEPSRED